MARGKRNWLGVRNTGGLRFESLEERRLLALVPELVADINLRGDGSDAQAGVAVGDDVYFLAQWPDRADQYDVWLAPGDGAEPANLTNGTVVIRPDEAHLTAVGDRVVFRGYAHPLGMMGIWSTDGTVEGTSQIHDTGFESAIAPFLPFEGELYYQGLGENDVPWLKKTNGLAGGTVAVSPLPVGTDWRTAVVAGDDFYFFAGANINDRVLWTTDGSSEGTRQLMATDFSAAWLPSTQLKALGDFVYFAAEDVTHGLELWRTNGEQTEIVDDQLGDADGLANAGLFATENYVYVTCYSQPDRTGLTLMRSDGGSLSPIVVLNNHLVRELKGVDDQFYFIGANMVWVSNGDPDNTFPVYGMNPSGGFHHIDSLEYLNGRAYFAENFGLIPSDHRADRNELWTSDGTPEGTLLLASFQSGDSQYRPHDFLAGATQLYFTGDAPTTGAELWRTDGTVAGTTLVKDVNPETQSSEAWYFTAADDSLYFLAQDQSGLAVYAHDSANTAPQRLAAFADAWINGCRGLESQHPDSFLEAGETLTYFAPDFGRYLARSDGTPEGAVMLYDFGRRDYTGADRRMTEMVSLGDYLIFDGYDAEHGTEPWVSDGTPEGTHLLVDAFPNSGNFGSPRMFTRMGDYVYFIAGGPLTASNLWRTDGTVEGTTIVKEFFGVEIPAELQLRKQVAVFNDVIYFPANGPGGVELWRTDGTAEGTYLFVDLAPGGTSSNPFQLETAGGYLYFTANSQLWRTDGTAEGTISLLATQGARGFAGAESTSYFLLGGPVDSRLWRSNGTPEGTQPIEFGPEFGYPSRPWAVPGGFVFIGQFEGGVDQLWYSDGTVAGTRALVDSRFPASIAESGSLLRLDGDLYLQGNLGTSGMELVRLGVLSGDSNFDGVVDLVDLNNVRNNFGGAGLGDANGDGFVDLEDLNAVRNNFGAGSGSPQREQIDAAAEAKREASSSLWQDALFVAAESSATSPSQRKALAAKRLKAIDRLFAAF